MALEFWIRCNGADVHFDVSEKHLDGTWGGEQCEGCGLDVGENARFVRREAARGDRRPLRGTLVCDCGARYELQSGDRDVA